MKNFKANISREQFAERLPDNVITGQPWIVFTPLGVINLFSSNKKYFYGKYDGNSFSLTKNSFFSPSPFIVTGQYELADDNQSADVTYRIKPLFLSFFVSRLLLFATLFVIYRGPSVIDDVYANYESLITAGIALSVYTLVLLAISKRKKEELEEIFRSVFVFT